MTATRVASTTFLFDAALLTALGVTAVAATRPSPAQKCEAVKLKEVGKYDACRFAAQAKAALKGVAPDSAKCGEKLPRTGRKWSRSTVPRAHR